MNTTTNDINNLVDASGELLSEIGNEKGEEIVALRERLKKSLAALKQSIADGAQQATEQVKNAAVAVDDYVHDNPWAAIGIAVAVAAAVGFAAGATSTQHKKLFGIF